MKELKLIENARKYYNKMYYAKNSKEKEANLLKYQDIIETFINDNLHGIAIMLENGRFRDAALLIKVYNDKNYISFINNTDF